jgi:hypothetical protein
VAGFKRSSYRLNPSRHELAAWIDVKELLAVAGPARRVSAVCRDRPLLSRGAIRIGPKRRRQELQGTCRSRRVSIARQTSPMPPRPMNETTSYAPRRAPGPIAIEETAWIMRRLRACCKRSQQVGMLRASVGPMWRRSTGRSARPTRRREITRRAGCAA